MRCTSHGADRIRPRAIQPTGAEAFPGEDDRSNDRDGLVTEGEPQAGESIRVVRESGGERYENRPHPCRLDELVPLAGGLRHDPDDARIDEPRQVILDRCLRSAQSLLNLNMTHWAVRGKAEDNRQRGAPLTFC